ncbi:MAG: IS21-like element helper ATPase IstB [Thermotogota bacterium]|nr:IS21-like element helper ATPase IstB [Thermotogota bacterium]
MKEIIEGKLQLICKRLRLPGVRQHWQSIAREATEKTMDYGEFLLACLEEEITTRHQKRLTNNLKRAKFPLNKTLNEFDFKEMPSLSKGRVLQLAQNEYVRRKENIICVGKPGTGKTHIAIALGLAAVNDEYRVKFTTIMQLIQELLLAEKEYRLPHYLKQWKKYDLVICDELGYVPLGEGGKLLFQFISNKYESGSLIITTNLEFSRWTEVFTDPALTAAMLDRLTHHSNLLLFEGESFRFKESASKTMKYKE